MIVFIKAMIALYIKRYETRLFLCVERNKGDTIEYVYHDCSVPTILSNEERRLLMKFEDGYFFDSSFMFEENFREMHLDLIRYYILNTFNRKENRRVISKYAWTYIPSTNEKIVNVYDEKNSKDGFMRSVMFKDCDDETQSTHSEIELLSSEKDEEYVIV